MKKHYNVINFISLDTKILGGSILVL